MFKTLLSRFPENQYDPAPKYKWALLAFNARAMMVHGLNVAGVDRTSNVASVGMGRLTRRRSAMNRTSESWIDRPKDRFPPLLIHNPRQRGRRLA